MDVERLRDCAFWQFLRLECPDLWALASANGRQVRGPRPIHTLKRAPRSITTTPPALPSHRARRCSCRSRGRWMWRR